MSVLTTLPNVIEALSSRALGKEDTFDVPAAKALSLLTHSPRRGGRVGAGCVRLVCPALEDVFTGHRKDAASLQSPTSSASQEAWPINVEEPKPQGGSVSSRELGCLQTESCVVAHQTSLGQGGERVAFRRG